MNLLGEKDLDLVGPQRRGLDQETPQHLDQDLGDPLYLELVDLEES